MKNLIKRKKINDAISKAIIFILSIASVVALLTMFWMIIRESIPAYKNFGFFHMYFTADFSAAGGWGIWGRLELWAKD